MDVPPVIGAATESQLPWAARVSRMRNGRDNGIEQQALSVGVVGFGAVITRHVYDHINRLSPKMLKPVALADRERVRQNIVAGEVDHVCGERRGYAVGVNR